MPSVSQSSVSQQTSASSQVITFSTPENFSCNNILIDASHDGGVWWFPQSSSFDQNAEHQGKNLAQYLRDKGFRVDELPRGQKLSHELLKNYAVILRANGFEAYQQEEVEAYSKALDAGVVLMFFTDHKKYDVRDELAELLDVEFTGVVDGTVATFSDHSVVKDLEPFKYMVGSVLTNTEKNKNIQPIGWLSDGSPVMGILHHPKSSIFLMGDLNAIEFATQPLADRLLQWTTTSCNGR
jgi:hypothetical protein